MLVTLLGMKILMRVLQEANAEAPIPLTGRPLIEPGMVSTVLAPADGVYPVIVTWLPEVV
jgi:hypothetical protein